MAKDAYYFKHDSNARFDSKLITVRMQYGHEGYGLYWMILEVLRDQDGYRYPLDQNGRRSLAFQVAYSEEKLMEYLEFCCDCGLFRMEEGHLWSESFCRRMEKIDARRMKNRENIEKYWDSVKSGERPRERTDQRAIQTNIQLNKQLNNDCTFDCTSIKRITTEENIKNNKPPKGGLGEMIDEYTDNEELRETLWDFAENRRKTKNPLTEVALKRIFGKLDKLSEPYRAKDRYKIESLDRSIANNWKDVFEVRDFEDDLEYIKPPPELLAAHWAKSRPHGPRDVAHDSIDDLLSTEWYDEAVQ